MKHQQTVASLVNSIANLDISNNEDTDDDMQDTTVYMVRTSFAIGSPAYKSCDFLTLHLQRTHRMMSNK